jgi:hypothetical protein
MTDVLFAPVQVPCQDCAGEGLIDVTVGRGWQPCNACAGLGSHFTKSAAEIEALRQRVLAAHPDAAAEAVPDFFEGVVVLKLAENAMINLVTTRAVDGPIFDGYPYLITRLVPTLYHIILLPGDASERDLAEIVRAQWRANRLDTCLVVGPDRALYIDATGHDRLESSPPRSGFPVTGKLQPPRAWPDTTELQERQRRLDSFIEALPLKPRFLLGDPTKGRREASPDDVARLAGVGPEGVPRGLELCPTCGEWSGACLNPGAESFLQVMTVHCPCQNDNRCAACGRLLYERKLNANYYNPSDRQIWHVPGFSGCSHRCPPPPAAIPIGILPRAR